MKETPSVDPATASEPDSETHQPPVIRSNPANRELAKAMPRPEAQEIFCTKGDGYRGIWWGQTATGDEYVYKYSGGLGTYPVQNAPFAVYREEVGKTFFVWGGATVEGWRDVETRGPRWDYGSGELLHMVSYYDHRTGQVPRPTVLFDKWTADPHDNPVLTIDDEGYLWIFSPSHGHWTTPSFVHRSVEPYSIEQFVTVSEGLFAYPQVWWTRGKGLSFFHTNYGTVEARAADRGICYRHSRDGFEWGSAVRLGCCELGHYQVTAERSGVVATAFDVHPNEGGLEARTNFYYLQSTDFGKTWTTAAGEEVVVPVDRRDHPALVRDFHAEGLLCYIKHLVLDGEGNPHVHLVTSRGWEPGPEKGPHVWHVATCRDGVWIYEEVLRSDCNYDMGSLTVQADGSRSLVGTSGKGPQEFNTGGEVELWSQSAVGEPWTRERVLTDGSERNHSHPRCAVDAHAEFRALWADGHTRQPSPSRLYFTNAAGDVRVLPDRMDDDFATPLPERGRSFILTHIPRNGSQIEAPDMPI